MAQRPIGAQSIRSEVMTRPPDNRRAVATLVVVLIALAGTIGAAVVTRAGAGLDADSVTYLDAAQNLRGGHGLTLTPGLSAESDPRDLAPLTHHPPLFPMLLAGIQWAGIDPLVGVRWVNVLLLAANASLVGLIVLSWTGSGEFAVLGTLLVVGSTDVFRAHTWVLTEPMFLAAVLGGLWWLVGDLERPRRSVLAAAMGAMALAALTRYVGLAAIATGALAITLWGPMSAARRWGRAALFAAGAGMPLLGWLVRNRILYGSLTGKHLVLHSIPANRVRQGLDSLSAWLLPEVTPAAIRYSAVIAVALVVVVAWWCARGRAEADLESWRRERIRLGCRVFGSFALLYAAVVLATIFFFDAQVPLDGRLLAPLYATAVVLAMAGVAQLSSRVPRSRSPAMAAIVLLVGISLTGTTLWAVGSQLDEMGYASRLWRESALVGEVRALRDDVRVFSNAPDALYVLTGRPARLVPLKADPFTRRENERFTEDLARLERDLGGRAGVVVYFRWLRWRWYLPPERELVERLHLVTIASVREGAMYGAAN